MAAVLGRGLTQGLRSQDSHRCMQSRFVLYYTVTIALNGVAIIGGVLSELDIHNMMSHNGNNYGGGGYYNHQYNNNFHYDRCDTWFFINALFGLAHIVAAAYIVMKIEEPASAVAPPAPSDAYYVQQADGIYNHNKTGYPTPMPVQEGIVRKDGTRSTADPASWLRIRHVLCENPIVAFYIILFIFYIGWQWFLDERPCSRGMAFAQRCADLFLMAGPASFVISVIMLMVRRRDI